jgi:DnaJ-class molecular chaperone
MIDELFADLPEQHPPTSLTTDTHVLDQCDICLGSGHVGRLGRCLTCNGTGWFIRPIGDRR